MAKRKKVRPGEAFVFRNGETAETLEQMVARLKAMDPAEFSHHVNEQRNDIYTWVRDCLDSKLAEKIRNVFDRDTLVSMLR